MRYTVFVICIRVSAKTAKVRVLLSKVRVLLSRGTFDKSTCKSPRTFANILAQKSVLLTNFEKSRTFVKVRHQNVLPVELRR